MREKVIDPCVTPQMGALDKEQRKEATKPCSAPLQKDSWQLLSTSLVIPAFQRQEATGEQGRPKGEVHRGLQICQGQWSLSQTWTSKSFSF